MKRLAAICAKHDILLIADEVITAFGRLGTTFGSDYFGISPDLITTAKGITNGTIPMGAVFVKSKIHDAFMNGPEWMIDFFHGYTYSGHPIACAAAIGTLDTYEEEGLLTRATELAPYWEERMHALKGLPHVIDIRNIGLIGAIEFEPDPAQPSKRAYDRFVKAFEKGLLVRTNRRHHRAVAAAHHFKERDRSVVRHVRDRSENDELMPRRRPAPRSGVAGANEKIQRQKKAGRSGEERPACARRRGKPTARGFLSATPPQYERSASHRGCRSRAMRRRPDA